MMDASRLLGVVVLTLPLAGTATAQTFSPGDRVECNQGGTRRTGVVVPFFRGDTLNGRRPESGYFHRLRFDDEDVDSTGGFCRVVDMRRLAGAPATRDRAVVVAPAPAPRPLPREASPAPAPGPSPASVPAAVVPVALGDCGPKPNPAMDRLGCVQQVSRVSPNWPACEGGDPAACHRFVRDVVRTLAAGDSRWGLITKPRGQQACTDTECGRHVSGGFGEDMAAYLPDGHTSQQWLGSDIVGGAGAPGARPQWGNPDGYANNRPDNLWAPLPK